MTIAYAITLTACPALSLPCGFTAGGLPVGLQIVGPPRGEAQLLAAAGDARGRAGSGALGADRSATLNPGLPSLRHRRNFFQYG